MLDQTPSRRIGKTGVQKRVASPGTAITWATILRAVQSEETRQAVLLRYRGAGFAPDDFRGHRPAREAIAQTLTRAEDHLELRSSATKGERRTIADVRRRLERELWP